MHVAPLRTLYGRGSKVLWRFRGNLVACTRGVRRQPFSTPLYIYRYLIQSYTYKYYSLGRGELKQSRGANYSNQIGSWGNQFGCCFGSRGGGILGGGGGDQIWHDRQLSPQSTQGKVNPLTASCRMRGGSLAGFLSTNVACR